MTGQQDINGKPPLSDADAPNNTPETEFEKPKGETSEPPKSDDSTGAADAATLRAEDQRQRAEAEPVDFQAAHEAEIRDLTDRLLRAHAEMDNLRKRTEREKSDTAKYAITKFAVDMVGIRDNLQRAVDAASNPTNESPEMKALIDGVVLTAQELSKALERHGVQRIEAQGKPFDPHQHQAVMEQPDPNVPSGTVVQVFQDGYTIGDRVLRPAMVVVARGGQKSSPTDTGQTPTDAEASQNATGSPDTGAPSQSQENGQSPDAETERTESPKADGTNG